MTDTKKEVGTVLQNLPDDCTLEDVQYGLYILQKVKRGLEAVDRGEGIGHDEAVKRLGEACGART
jgi:hypothetical protein